jgi:hypothetical protein
MRHQPPSAPSTGQQLSPPPGWIARHKVLTGVGAFVAICLIGSAASAASGHAKSTTPNKITTSSSHTESVTSAATTSASAQQAVDATLAAAKAAAQKAAAATASKAAAAEAAAVKAAAAKAAADKAAAAKAAAARAAAAAAAPPTTSASNCTPGYDPCIPPGPDVDCAGGTGNGPRYVQGPITVTGNDPYRLDADHNGIGCEN